MASDDFRALEDRLLRFETFDKAMELRTLALPSAAGLSSCDNHAQRALLLLEMRLAESTLRSGEVLDFDQHIKSLQTRSRRVLACVPRDSFVWVLLFGLQLEQGRLDGQTFDLLDASYETSPNEAWIGTRRIAVALPVVLQAPESVRNKILAEFQDLIRTRFLDVPAYAYLTVPAPVRTLLEARVEELDSPSRKAFSDAIRRLRP
jgi:hypothetical protein